ncbi:3-hydroxyisobutyryl-CoA hydrolase [Coemansia erecta]|nr:3-hydroxyisobutyryl-CoA hydrolase [Coemansia erecta]
MLSTQGTNEGDKHVLSLNNLTGRTMVLNRPKALNSLTLAMVRTISRYLRDWEASELCNVVMMRSSSAKAFCAGGDVVQVSRDWREGNKAHAMEFFRTEYRMNHHIATFTKPIVAMLDGYVMGGGVGLSMHAPFRVASERSVFAMPETKIGFFPDVGASFFLPRLDGELGLYLGLTGQQLRARDLLYAGVATHYVPSERHAALEQRLQGLGSSDFDVVNAAIEEFVDQPENPDAEGFAGIAEGFAGIAEGVPIAFSLAPVRDAIDTCFKFNTVESIVQALAEIAGDPQHAAAKWAEKTLAQLHAMSPSSLKLTLEQLRMGAKLNIQQVFTLELGLAERRLESHDMHEGIDALLVRKSGDPKWVPDSLEAVHVDQLHKEYFEGAYKTGPSFVDTQAVFTEYPHKFGLPTEHEILGVVSGENPQAGEFGMTYPEVMAFFDREYHAKIGVEQKVHWVLKRRTNLVNNDSVLKVKPF